MTPILYAGPTLARLIRMRGTSDCVAGVDVRPPIARGDLTRVVTREPPGVVVICDGLFHLGQLAVGHAEIRVALEHGWRVWGVASMGAIRAAEMRSLGMRGHGAVYARYCEDPDFCDDEVTMLHEPEAPWRELSEPLIHLRAAAADLVKGGVLAASTADQMTCDYAARWFGERTLPDFGARLARAGVPAEIVAATLGGFDRYRIKASDLGALLDTRPFAASLAESG